MTDTTDYLKLGRLAGWVFLVNLIPYVVAHMVILDNLIYTSDYLYQLATHRTQVGAAVLMEFVSITAMVAFALIVYPLLRKVNDVLAMGYLGLRFVEFGIIVLGMIKLMTLMEMTPAVFSDLDPDRYQILARSILGEWQWNGIIYMLVYVLHCTVFFFLLYRSQVVPKAIAVAGLLGTVLGFANIIHHLFDLEFGGFFLFAPMGIVELILALWLVWKGFLAPKGLSRGKSF